MTSIPTRLQGFVGVARREATARVVPLELGSPAQMLLASLSGAAGVIHLVMVPSHMGEWAVEGIGFALAGWFQLAVAALIFARPSRVLLETTVVVNAVLIGLWALSRTAGLPFGPHAGHPESRSFIDLTCVGIEAALIGAAALFSARPALARNWSGDDRLMALALSVAVLVLATAALASPSARNHAAASHGDHGHAVDDKGLSLLTNGHHENIVQHELDAPAQAALDTQIEVTRRIARQYPTVADAEAAGYRRAGPYSPGLGAHYIQYGAPEMNADGVVDERDALHPLAIIYDGTDASSPVAGFMYYSMSATEPEGFAGPNDVWHYHSNVCLKYSRNGEIEAPLGADNDVTGAQCAAAGGSLLPVTQWMAHVWPVPGYDNVDGGVFAEVNPALDCPDGTYYRRPIEEWAAHPLSTCRLQSS